MECKDHQSIVEAFGAARINRNIVECKEIADMIGTKVINSINRNIVECKGISSQLLYLYFPVLIETLWNVKALALIGLQRGQAGINRNIVECKGAYQTLLPEPRLLY